ncbi:MAG: ammonia-forming cytochrome c nitrite reductase subunit c552 [Phycisphaeraceae bacterium]
MTDTSANARSSSSPVLARRWGRIVYVLAFIFVAAATSGVMFLMANIAKHKREAQVHYLKLVELDEDTIDPAEWGKNFPRQYDGYKRAVDTERTRHGGSEAFQKLDEDPRWRELFNGYGFGVDYREERGHAYMLSDQDISERITQFSQPGACLHCHASIIPAYRQKGREVGIPDDEPREQVMKGFEIVNGMPYDQARKLVDHPISCVDCHDPQTMHLRVTRPGFINGIRALARSDQPVPHLPSIERWRNGARVTEYAPNTMATRQEMRSLVCGQCHVEYYFKGEGKMLTYPWHEGIKVEQIESYYDHSRFKDWTHKTSAAPLLKAQHPEFETWSQGIHARSGVACADCHMPYKREGSIKISDHHVRSPLLNVARACQTCHVVSEDELRARAETIQDRTRDLMIRTEDAVLGLIWGIDAAATAGATDEQLARPRQMHRKAQWRLDFVAAENSMGFHAPQETARILGEAIDYARQGQVEAVRLQFLHSSTSNR